MDGYAALVQIGEMIQTYRRLLGLVLARIFQAWAAQAVVVWSAGRVDLVGLQSPFANELEWRYIFALSRGSYRARAGDKSHPGGATARPRNKPTLSREGRRSYHERVGLTSG